MQPKERIGLVVVLFLVAFLVVGFFWDDGAADDNTVAAAEPKTERVDEEAARRAAAEADRIERLKAASAVAASKERNARASSGTRPMSSGPSSSQAGAGRPGSVRGMPMGGQDEVVADVSRVTTMSSGSDHRSDRRGNGGAHGAGGSQPQQGPGAVAQSADELLDLARPNRAAQQPPAGETVSMNSRSARRRAEADQPRTSRAPAGPTAAEKEAERKAEKAKLAAAKKPKARSYTVKPGDALQKIAQRELGDAKRSAEIASLNGLSDPDSIRIGMVLTLPERAAAQVAGNSAMSSPLAQAATPASNGAVGSTYKIKAGEPLSRALTRELGTYKRSIALVVALNPGLNPDRVKAGQVINLPRPEDIPGESQPKTSSKKKRSRSSAPALDTSARGSRVASATRKSASSSRTDSEFVVR